MTTVSPLRPVRPSGREPGPEGRRTPPWRPARNEEPTEARAARLRLRKRLVLWSLPVVVVLLLVAIKLVGMVSLGEQAATAYAAGNVTGTEDAANRLGFLNLIEPHKAPFARGDARALAGDDDGARSAFEEALTLAPPDSREGCQIRVNLVLSLEKLAQAAQGAGRADAATAFYDRLQQVVSGAPSGCFDGDAQQEEGQQLRDAQQRAEQQQDAQQRNPQDPQGGPSPADQSSQDKQQQLDDKTKDNLAQRNEGNEQQGSNQRPPVAKPW